MAVYQIAVTEEAKADECARNEFRGKVARDHGFWVQGALRLW